MSNSISRQNIIGMVLGRSDPVPTGINPATGKPYTSVTYTVDMDHSEVIYVGSPPDPNRLRLQIKHDTGFGFREVPLANGKLWTDEWVSGPGQSPLSVTWTWDPSHPPIAVQVVLDNRNQADAGVLAPVFA